MVQFSFLLEELDADVAPAPRSKGEMLFEEGLADVIDARPGLLRAAVDGGRNRYKVRIDWGDDGYTLSCSCGTPSDRVCEHIWASVLTASEDGWFDEIGTLDNGMTYLTRRSVSGSAANRPPVPADRKPRWKDALKQLAPSPADPHRALWPTGREVLYIIDREDSRTGKGIVLEIAYREPKKDGQWCKPKSVRIARDQLDMLPDGQDRTIIAMLTGAESGYGGRYDYGDYYYGQQAQSRYRLTGPLARAALPAICRTGRCLLRSLRTLPDDLRPQSWGSDQPWTLTLQVTRDASADHYNVQGTFDRDTEKRPLTAPIFLTTDGLVFWGDTIEPFDDRGAYNWLVYLRQHKTLRIPTAEGLEFAREIYTRGSLPALDLPQDLRMEEVRPPLKRVLKIKAPKPNSFETRLIGQLTFEYEGHEVSGKTTQRTIVQPERRRVIHRDADAESQAQARLHQLGFRMGYFYDTRQEELTLAPSKLAKTVSTLVKEGWHVQADGKLYRQPGEIRIEVSSGIDWFELHGGATFGDQVATLPQLLAALRKGESMVQLGDGTMGMLPEEWLKKYAPLAGMGKEEGDHLNFTKSQAGLLDALLAAQPQATCDALFEKTRQMLRNFDGIEPESAPTTFHGELRPYQNDGLGWLTFLRKFNFGGCLADDMGLGKTVQVLAMLEARRQFQHSQFSIQNSPRRPSLIVVPRSLIFNWLEEAKPFTPNLKILDHSHHARAKATHHFADHDVVLTTYGTLRNDAAYIKDVHFDYAILDEAQAIKNPSSESAKAARLLNASHRLALSGTPVQNHLGDLWSLFEFLNPGMLGASSVLNGGSALTKAVDPDTRALLSKALRPFILRRTKEQVAKDLPEKLEQTIYCELDSTQRKAYDELKKFYRASLLDLVAKEGINKAKIQILEALLRLRQAACHPGLIDKTKTSDSSAKLDTLIPRLVEIAEEGHKALVFSQFTSFLAIVKKRLDKEKIKYEYLDGKTKDRQARVDKFQSDPKLKIFLISLKAGGVGLNLTAADYVFLLDPWWNPAVEAQAIDRTHRIGQTRQVFACRLIAKDTVEEKVLQLQQGKRELAEAIIGQDNSVISTLGRTELELLLS
jgi:superfamily II DNA or RNA helicase